MHLARLKDIGIHYINKCEELNVNLYFPLPKKYNIWFGEPAFTNNYYNNSFNLSKIIEGDIYILLDKIAINDIKARGETEKINCSSIFVFNDNKMVKINAFEKIKTWNENSTFFRENLFKEYYLNNERHVKKTSIEYKPSLKLKCPLSFLILEKNNLFYFSEQNNDFCAHSDISISINVDVENIYFEKNHLKGLLEDTDLSKAYQVPKEYQNYEALCNLAKLGRDIFVTMEVDEPKTKADKVKLIECREIYRSKRFTKDKAREETAYFLIKPQVPASANVEHYKDGPQIKHLMNISESKTKEEKKEEVRHLFKSEPKSRYALKFITQKTI